MTTSQTQFDAHAERYAASTVHHAGPSLAVLRKFAEPCAADVAVDVATGTGSTAFALAPHVAQVIGIDVASKMLEQGRARAAREGISNVRFLDGSAEDIPLADGASTLVTSRHAPHHFHDMRRFLAEVRRILTPKGRFVLADQITPDPSMHEWVDGWQRLHDPSHVRQRTVEEWHAEAHAAGFVATREEVVPYRLEFAWWTETSGCSADSVNALRAHARSASVEVRHAMGLEYDAFGDVSAYRLPVLVVRLDPVNS
jgi:ubiquinone/menaquinone biosynthesis C-methylase UbiE